MVLATLLYMWSDVEKEADPDSDPTRTPACIWLPPIIQSQNTEKKQSLKYQIVVLLHLPTHVNTIYLDFHHNDAISSEGDKKMT